ncbi:hypothetical protein AB0H12_30250 [Actinosynnema sp. NPDC023794]
MRPTPRYTDVLWHRDRRPWLYRILADPGATRSDVPGQQRHTAKIGRQVRVLLHASELVKSDSRTEVARHGAGCSQVPW